MSLKKAYENWAEENATEKDGFISGTYQIGFDGDDQTELYGETFTDLQDAWNLFCEDCGVNRNTINYIEFVCEKKI